MIEVILRTCTRANVTNNGWQRFVPFSKKEIVIGCATSLFSAIAQAQTATPIKTLILDDGSDDETLLQLKTVAQKKNIDLTLQQLGGVGFNESALLQFDLCRKSQAQYVYSVEDDYLHSPDSLLTMFSDIQHFERQTQHPQIAIHPFDDPFTYFHADKMANSKIVLGRNRHWRTNTFSTHTLFAKPSLFREHWAPFEKLAKEYGHTDTNEHTTINLLWNNGIDREGPVFLFTPIPSLALHLSYNNEPPFIDWQMWWDNYRQ